MCVQARIVHRTMGSGAAPMRLAQYRYCEPNGNEVRAMWSVCGVGKGWRPRRADPVRWALWPSGLHATG
jgi:hypothetical protein